MRAATIRPGDPDSATISDRPEPRPQPGELLVDGVRVGVCATDAEVRSGAYGRPPEGSSELVPFHESLGRVREAPPASGFSPGDWVVGMVRRPDPHPCAACAAGEPDFCRNGEFTERGIKGLDGFGAQRWTIPADYAISTAPALGRLAVLTEPTTVVAKAWEQAERVGGRTVFAPRRALVTGAGPIGLLAALLGVQRGLDVHVLDRVTEGPKPGLVRDLGATYHSDLSQLDDARVEPDVVIECTGAAEVVFSVLAGTARNAVTVLTGISGRERTLEVPASAVNNQLVLENDAVVGSVSANRRHFEAAADALRSADTDWLQRLITRRLPLSNWTAALHQEQHDVKVVVEIDSEDSLE